MPSPFLRPSSCFCRRSSGGFVSNPPAAIHLLGCFLHPLLCLAFSLFFYPPDSDHFRDASRSTDSRWEPRTPPARFWRSIDQNEKCIKEAKAKIHFHSANQDAELSLFFPSSIQSSASGISCLARGSEAIDSGRFHRICLVVQHWLKARAAPCFSNRVKKPEKRPPHRFRLIQAVVLMSHWPAQHFKFSVGPVLNLAATVFTPRTWAISLLSIDT